MNAPSRLPPGPRWTIPSTLAFIRDPFGVTAKLRREHGDTVLFPSLNGKLVLVMTPALAEVVLRTPPSSYGPWAMGTIGHVLGPRSLLVTEGTTHRADRKLLSPPFHGRRMKAYGEQMRRAARRWFERSFVPGEETRLLDVTTALTMDVIIGSVFGVAEGPEFDEGRALLDQLGDVSPLLLFTRFSHTPLFSGYRKMTSVRARFRDWIGERIDEAKANPDAGEDILSLLLAARYDDDSAMTREDLESQLLTLLFAGHETTAIALAWAGHWLGRHPEVLDRLRTELAALGTDPAPDEVAGLPYLQAVCDETLRLNPIVTENLRKLKAPLELGDYTLPAGMGVSVSIAAIHSDPDLYPEPDRFRPERFLERRFSPFEFLPFGGGHRRCIGGAFAAWEMRIAVAELVQNWDWELVAPDERPTRRSVTMGPEQGVPIRVLKRRSVG